MSGAKNCPETTRQKMIGMMYLVLTAMLALNVSSEILNGFTMVDNSLHTTIESTEMRNKSLIESFEYQYKQNPAKVKEWLDKANNVTKLSNDLYDYIQNFKFQIIKIADCKKADPAARVIEARDNLDAPEEYGKVKGNGKVLKQKMDTYRNALIKLLEGNPDKQKVYQKVFSTDRLNGKPWQDALFDMMPVSATVTLLSKYQSDIRSSESEMIQFLKSQTDADDYRVNKIEALVVPNSRYITRGGQYSAQIVLSAVDSTKKPEYFVNGSAVSRGIYQVGCGKSGSFTYSGFIRMAGNDGNVKSYPFKSDYIVGEPSATLSNEDLNVVYRGIDNKFSISVPGVAAEKVSVSVDGGSATKVGSGRYIIRPSRDGEIRISVIANIDGKNLPMGGGIYRVKYLPDPKSFLQYTDAGGVPRLTQDGTVSKRVLKSGVSIVANYGSDELIKANFTVTQFTLLTVFGPVPTSGSHLSAKQLNDIDRLEGGEFVIIKNIKAVGPDGKQRSLSPIQVQL